MTVLHPPKQSRSQATKTAFSNKRNDFQTCVLDAVHRAACVVAARARRDALNRAGIALSMEWVQRQRRRSAVRCLSVVFTLLLLCLLGWPGTACDTAVATSRRLDQTGGQRPRRARSLAPHPSSDFGAAAPCNATLLALEFVQRMYDQLYDAETHVTRACSECPSQQVRGMGEPDGRLHIHGTGCVVVAVVVVVVVFDGGVVLVV